MLVSNGAMQSLVLLSHAAMQSPGNLRAFGVSAHWYSAVAGAIDLYFRAVSQEPRTLIRPL